MPFFIGFDLQLYLNQILLDWLSDTFNIYISNIFGILYSALSKSVRAFTHIHLRCVWCELPLKSGCLAPDQIRVMEGNEKAPVPDGHREIDVLPEVYL